MHVQTKHLSYIIFQINQIKNEFNNFISLLT